MNGISRDDALTIMGKLNDIMSENKDFLIELDSVMGDGDLGLTMAKGFAAAVEEVKDSTEQEPGKIFMKAGMAIAKAAPSTMGTLVGTGFMRGGKAVAGKSVLDASDASVFFKAFVRGIMERGKAQLGEKTIIDSLSPAADALEESAGKGLSEALADALSAAKKGLEATKTMIAQHGRIAYYKDKAIGKQDPGATVGVLIIRGFSIS